MNNHVVMIDKNTRINYLLLLALTTLKMRITIWNRWKLGKIYKPTDVSLVKPRPIHIGQEDHKKAM